MQNFTTLTGLGSRKRMGRFAVAALSVAAAMACGGAMAQGKGNSAASESFAEGRILVMPRAGLPDTALDQILGEQGGGKGRRVGQSSLRIVDLPPGLEKQMVEKLARHPHIKFAELDQRVPLAATPNDPYLGSQWHLSKIGGPAAWDSSQGAGITIAILDSGVDGAHADLSSRMVAGWNFYDNNSNTADVHGHGTAVAGAAAATLNNGVGVASVAGQARIMPVRISAPDGYAYWSTVAQGVTWAADRGARVANISFGGVSASSSVQSAAQYMKNKGGLVVVAAGNNGIAESYAPTSTMITVAATDGNDAKTSWSSYGSFVTIAAPGDGIWTTNRGGGYGSWWGTSFASPVTAGVVGLMMAANGSLSGNEIETLLYSTAADLGAAGRDAVYGWGRVDAASAVSAAKSASSTTDTQAPSAVISAPLGSATVNGWVPVDVAVSDNKGVVRVDLMANGKLVASDSVSPFSFSWDSTAVANGTVSLVVMAADAAGNTGTSAAVSVNVANTVVVAVADTTPPVVGITNPVNGSTVSGTVSIKVGASDNAGSSGIRQTLYIGGKQVSSATGGSLSYSWNTRKVKSGAYTIQAVARDAAGNTSSQSVQVTR